MQLIHHVLVDCHIDGLFASILLPHARKFRQSRDHDGSQRLRHLGACAMSNAIGTDPSDAASAVIATGCNLASAPSQAARLRSIPLSFTSWIEVTFASPLSTAMPDCAMKPMAAEI
jgi:hypothetical protein